MSPERDLFSHERLEVYGIAVEFLAIAQLVIVDLPRGLAPLSDQFRRAATSIVLNIAEGVGRLSDADRRRHYGIARGSALECAAALDVFRVLRTVSPPHDETARRLLLSVVRMLTVMTR